MKITKASNGYIVANDGHIEIFEEKYDDDPEALVNLLNYISSYFDSSSRYSEQRVHALLVPGDKNDNPVVHESLQMILDRFKD